MSERGFTRVKEAGSVISMDVNVPLIRKTLERIEERPEEWNQDHWAISSEGCGTTMCFAGTALVLAGWDLVWTETLDVPSNTKMVDFARSPDGQRTEHVEVAAAEALGLTEEQAGWIFYSEPDSTAGLRRIVEDVVGERL